MRKLVAISLILLSYHVLGISQNTPLDSLKSVLNDMSSDEEKVNILTKIIPLEKDSLLFEKYSKEALELSKRLGDYELQCKIYRHRTLQYADYNNLSKALEVIEKSINLNDKISRVDRINNLIAKGNLYLYNFRDRKQAQEIFEQAQEINLSLAEKDRIIACYSLLGNIYRRIGKIEKAKEYYQITVDIGKRRNERMYPALIGLGIISKNSGDYTSALSYYIDALKEMEKVNSRNQDVALKNIGNLFNSQGDFVKAEEYFNKLLDFGQESKRKDVVIVGHISLGTAFGQQEKIEKAEYHFQEAIRLSKEGNYLPLLLKSYTFIADLYNEVHRYDEAFSALTKALELSKEQPQTKTGAAIMNYTAGSVFLQKGQYNKAEKYLKASLEFAKSFNNKERLKYAEVGLATLYEKQAKFANALKHFKNFHFINDSLTTDVKNEQIAEIETKYETDKKEAENKTLLATNQFIAKQNQQYKIGAGILTGLLALLGYFFIQLRKTRNQLAAQNQQLKDLNATKDKFFGIIAHDIRSPITALDGVSEQMNYYLEKDDKAKLNRLADRIDTTAKRLTSLLDNLLNWALLQTGMIPYNPKSVNIQTVAQENIDLFQPVAEAKNIKLNNEISAASPVFSDESALQTIIRNLVNNAIKFTPKGGEVSISTEEKGNKIFIKINDTGTGIAADKLEKLFSLEKQSSKGTAGEKGSGLGLMLCKELVELNKGTIQAISELGKGSSFVFSLPKN